MSTTTRLVVARTTVCDWASVLPCWDEGDDCERPVNGRRMKSAAMTYREEGLHSFIKLLSMNQPGVIVIEDPGSPGQMKTREHHGRTSQKVQATWWAILPQAPPAAIKIAGTQMCGAISQVKGHVVLSGSHKNFACGVGLLEDRLQKQQQFPFHSPLHLRKQTSIVYLASCSSSQNTTTSIRMVPNKPSRSEETLLFAKNFLQHPKMLGSLIPSSRFLVDRLLKKVDWQRARTLVEYGPGVGTFTAHILHRMGPEARLLGVELNR